MSINTRRDPNFIAVILLLLAGAQAAAAQSPQSENLPARNPAEVERQKPQIIYNVGRSRTSAEALHAQSKAARRDIANSMQAPPTAANTGLGGSAQPNLGDGRHRGKAMRRQSHSGRRKHGSHHNE